MPFAAYVTLLVMAPLVEETLFRAGLQQRLLDAGVTPRRAGAITTALFIAAHGVARSWWLALAVSLPAVGLAWLYQRTGSVSACVAAHAALNACWLGIAPWVAPAMVSSPLMP